MLSSFIFDISSKRFSKRIAFFKNRQNVINCIFQIFTELISRKYLQMFLKL